MAASLSRKAAGHMGNTGVLTGDTGGRLALFVRGRTVRPVIPV